MCGIIGYVGPRECKHLLLYGLERLEYRGYDSAGIALLEADGLQYTRAVGNLQNLKLAAGDSTSPGDDRARPHALGDARRRHERERASPRGRGSRGARDRPQRDRRELPRAARPPRRERSRLHVGDRRRDGQPPDPGALRRRPRRGDAPRVQRARGALRLRRDPPRPPGPARRRPPCSARSSSASARARRSSPRTRPRSCARRARCTSPRTATSSRSPRTGPASCAPRTAARSSVS